jgi:CBS domain-containing protein
MALVGEVAASPAIVVPLHASVVDAAQVMRDNEVGDVVVVDNDGLIAGMLTDRDVTVRVVAERRDPEHTEVKEVCTLEPVTIDPMASTNDAERLMREHLIHRLPLVDSEGRPRGVISLEDLAASGYVEDHEFREVAKVIARAYQLRSTVVP